MSRVTRACAYCRGPLLACRRRFCCDLCRLRGQRAERVTENGDFGRAAIRMIRAMARRIGASDLAEFGAVWEVMAEAERAAVDTIAALKAAGFTYAELGREIGWERRRLSQWYERRLPGDRDSGRNETLRGDGRAS